MSTRIRTRVAASIVAASLALAGGVAAAPAASAAPVGTDLDYFSYAYPGLRADSVFTPVTFERFERLLNSDGTYAFLIGGPADTTTSATVAHIDAVAQQYGVDTIYAFDPRLDGEAIDIRTTELADLAALWTRVVTNSLNKDTTPAFGGDPSDDPYLFIYDRSHTAGGVEDRIVASLGGAVDAASLGDGTAYRAQVAAVFDTVAVGGAVEVDTQSQFEFFRDAVNQKHASQYSNAALYGGDIFAAADEQGFALRSITYPELVQVLESEGDHVILFGGTWCHNTRAVIKDVNRAAAAAGVDTVYVFDLRLDGASAGNLHIRDTASTISYLYGDLVAKHFPNLRTQYVTNGSAGQRVDYYPGGDTTAPLTAAKKLQVPYLIEYDRSNAAAPIAQDWIRDNGNGTFTEYMTEWWWVTDQSGALKRDNQTEVAYQTSRQRSYDLADEAIVKVDAFFGLPGGVTVPGAPATPTVAVDGTTVTVSWPAHPVTGGSPLTGFTVAVGGTTAQAAANAWSHVFENVAPGTHAVTLAATNGVGTSAASAPASAVVAAPPVEEPGEQPGEGNGSDDEVTPSASVTGDLRPGGKIVVTGEGLPAGTAGVEVEIRSTPQSLGTVTTTAAGTFRLETTIPSSIAPGAHTVVVLIDGQVVASSAVTVGAASAASLPATGTVVPVVAITAALALLVAGVALQIVRRRRATV